ncbi:hypothetical protein NECAME_19011, partial [Necator americanus]
IREISLGFTLLPNSDGVRTKVLLLADPKKLEVWDVYGDDVDPSNKLRSTFFHLPIRNFAE